MDLFDGNDDSNNTIDDNSKSEINDNIQIDESIDIGGVNATIDADAMINNDSCGNGQENEITILNKM